MRLRTWAVLALTAFVVLTGPTDGLADLTGQAVGAFVLGFVLFVWLPDQINAWRSSGGGEG